MRLLSSYAERLKRLEEKYTNGKISKALLIKEIKSVAKELLLFSGENLPFGGVF